MGEGLGREQFGLERLDVSSSTRLTAERLSRTVKVGVKKIVVFPARLNCPLRVQPQTWVTYVPSPYTLPLGEGKLVVGQPEEVFLRFDQLIPIIEGQLFQNQSYRTASREDFEMG